MQLMTGEAVNRPVHEIGFPPMQGVPGFGTTDGVAELFERCARVHRFAECLILVLGESPGRSKAFKEVDNGLHGCGGDQVPGVRQHRELASL